MKTKVGNVRVPLSALADCIYQYSKYLRNNFTRKELTERGEDEESASGDFRLQVKKSGWQTHEGDSQFDQDHRGNWGSTSVPYGCTREEALNLARDLIDQAQESAFENEGNE
jgi:hypothetical protein